jgi:serine/threonine protein kinase
MLSREVESIKNPNIGYTKAVDMWSLGILTACMFTGGETLIPRHELPELNCEEIAARHLGSDNSHATVGWQHIPPRALRFIRRLIIINPEERMSADEALEDSWYMKPAGEAAALKDAIVRICRFWTKRDSDANILECFPGVILDATLEPDKQKTYARRKFPDSSLSPYFGLDRHLLQRPESTRKRLLEDLTQSGSQFVQSNELANGGFVVRQPHSRNPSPSIVSVVGNDIFGTYLQKSHHLLETVPELDEADKVLATSVSRNERVWTFTLSEQDNLCTSPGPDASINKRARNDSEDRGTHDAAAKKLPKYTTAKDLREAVNKMKVGSAIGGRVKTVKAV